MYKIVFLRHGESVWNKKGLFTGWTDVNLSKRGREEARRAGQELKKGGFVFDLAYTSLLKRAANTLKIVLEELSETKLPVKTDWRLNERHYGNLQGLNKLETVKKFGEKQVFLWRRSYSIRPPEIKKLNPYQQINDPKYKNIKVPRSESLKDVVKRVKAWWQEDALIQLKQKKRIIVSASGNSLRALVKYLDKMSAHDISQLNIPTGIPLVYELDKNFEVKKHYYLSRAEDLQKAIDKVKNQIKNKGKI